jgi:pimeloyl-ACP methyl ester carboxylesterase
MLTKELLRSLHSARSLSSQKPLVLLLGWLGAQQQHLDKYAEVYQDLADVAIMQPSMWQTAVPSAAHSGALKFVDSLSRNLETLHEDRDRPVIVQCMSNAGWLAFGTILHLTSLASAAAKEDPSAPLSRHLQSALAFKSSILDTRLRGIIVDSAPSYATPPIWARGTVSAALGKPAETVSDDLPSTVAAVQHLAERYLALPSISRHLRETRAAWGQISLNIPQLYLYSTADALIPAQQVENFIDLQIHRGIQVSHHCWDDSGHCEHLRVHPEQYTRLVHSFVERCLTDISAAESTL